MCKRARLSAHLCACATAHQDVLRELRAASAAPDALLAAVAARRGALGTRFLMWLGAQATAAEHADDDAEAAALGALVGAVLAACARRVLRAAASLTLRTPSLHAAVSRELSCVRPAAWTTGAQCWHRWAALSRRSCRQAQTSPLPRRWRAPAARWTHGWRTLRC
jgi:hypothetical protein